MNKHDREFLERFHHYDPRHQQSPWLNEDETKQRVLWLGTIARLASTVSKSDSWVRKYDEIVRLSLRKQYMYLWNLYEKDESFRMEVLKYKLLR